MSAKRGMQCRLQGWVTAEALPEACLQSLDGPAQFHASRHLAKHRHSAVPASTQACRIWDGQGRGGPHRMGVPSRLYSRQLLQTVSEWRCAEVRRARSPDDVSTPNMLLTPASRSSCSSLQPRVSCARSLALPRSVPGCTSCLHAVGAGFLQLLPVLAAQQLLRLEDGLAGEHPYCGRRSRLALGPSTCQRAAAAELGFSMLSVSALPGVLRTIIVHVSSTAQLSHRTKNHAQREAP